MSKVEFKYYLHDHYEQSEFIEFVLEKQLKLGLSEDEAEELMEKIGRPFYEVTFTCTLDTETGKVELVEAKL